MTYPTDTSDPTAALLADGRPFIRCAPCGFVTVSDSATENRWALEEHECPAVPPKPVRPPKTRHWYDVLDSFWFFMIVLVMAGAILAGMGVTKW